MMRLTGFIFIVALPFLCLGWIAGQQETAYAIPFLISVLALWLVNERVRTR